MKGVKKNHTYYLKYSLPKTNCVCYNKYRYKIFKIKAIDNLCTRFYKSIWYD